MDFDFNKAVEHLKQSHKYEIIKRANGTDSTTSMNVDGNPITKQQFWNFLGFENNLSAIADTPLAPLAFLTPSERKSRVSMIFEAILTGLVQDSIQAKLNETLNLKGFNYNNLQLVRDVITGTEKVLNTTIDRITDLSPEGYLRGFPRKMKEDIIVEAVNIKLEYRPYDTSPHINSKVEGQDIRSYNSCIHPAWRLEENKTKVEIPEIITTFLEYQYEGDKKQIHHIHSTVKRLLYKGRCGTYTCLLGVQGCGKNTFLNLLKNLVGETNYAEAPNSFLKKEFNSILRNKLVFAFDEQLCNTVEKIEKLKSYINSSISIEAKGVEVEHLEELHCSMFIMNNYKTSLKLVHADRRFSVMDVTDTTMIEHFGEKEAERINDILTNDQDVADQYAKALYWYDDTGFNSHVAYKGEKFEEVVMLSLTSWKGRLYDTLLSRKKEKYKYTKIFVDKYKDNPRSQEFVREWLRSYYYTKNEPIGHLEQSDELYIVPHPDLMPKREEEIKEKEYGI